MVAELYMNQQGEFIENPYNNDYSLDFDYPVGSFDIGLSDFPESFKKYEKWAIEQNIHFTLDYVGFKNDEWNTYQVCRLTFTDGDAALFRLTWE